MDEMNGNDNERRMPWPVRIALGWFVLLAVISCVPLVLAVVAWCRDADDYGLGMVCGPFCVALGVGFVLAILRNERDWLAVAYSIVGMLVAFVIFCCVLDSPANMKAVVGLIVTLVVVTTPLVLLYLPSSNRWYVSFPRKKRRSAVWCAVMIPFGIVMMAAMIYVSENSRQESRPATAMFGRKCFCLMRQHEQERTEGKPWVDIASCSNSLEFAEKLRMRFEMSDEWASRMGSEFSIAVNLPPDIPDSFPVMITANVDPAELPREWDGETDKDKLLELKPLEGVEPLRFGDRGIVVVRKSGAAQVIRRKFMTLGRIFGDEPFKFGKDTYFLTPVGKRKAGCK